MEVTLSNSINETLLKLLKARRISIDNEQLNSMVMYSGGADSLSLAKSVLETTNHKVVLHHVVLQNPENRDKFELDVIEAQLEYLKKNFRDFQFIQTRFNVNLSNSTGIKDMSAALFMAGTSCRALKKNFSIIYSGHMHETPMMDFMEASAVLNALFSNRRAKPIWIYPFKYININQRTSKLEIYRNIGPKGLELTVSCRRPTLEGKKFVSCFTCPACKVRHNTVKTLGWDENLVK